MEQSEGRGKGKKVQDSSSNAEQSQAEMGSVGQNIMDPQLRRLFSNRISAQRSRQKKVKLVEELENRAKMLQDQVAQLQSIQARQQSRMHSLMVEEQTLFHEMEYLEKKAMLRDGKVVSSLESEDEKNRKKKSRLEKLRDIKQQQLLNLHDPFAGLSIDTSSNQGDGARSSSRQELDIAAAVDEIMDQTNLSMETARNPNL
ncbi:bZIP transcription factor 30 [Vigna angularis]|uniref:bZIP transcription factor 30 n=1 Tax=Phaseolus angularis TaxID=3914 RepID=UPI000809AA45|nr:bZIP transcription factor 30 [Vigna angularis]